MRRLSSLSEHSQFATIGDMTVTSGDRLLTSSKAKSTQAEASKLTNRPAIAHLIDMNTRFGERLGIQFGAAITYFLVLALIPTLMFAFAGLGFFLSVVRPDLMDVVNEQIASAGGGNDQLVDMLQGFFSNWAGVGIVAVLSSLYTAQGFIGNLKDAVRSQLNPDGIEKDTDGFVKRIVNNIGTLLGILVGAFLAIALNVVSSSLREKVIEWLALPAWTSILFQIVPFVVSVAACWLILYIIFTLLPKTKTTVRTKTLGTLVGAIAMALLLRFATLLIDVFSGSPTAALFGPVIAIMLSLNIFARIILMVAAWIGTANDRPVFERIASAPVDGPKHEGESAAETMGAIVTACGLIALTLFGFKKLEERRER